MLFLKLFLGVLFLVAGWVYLFHPSFVIALNRFAREEIFNDRRLLLERRKLAVLFFCLSFLALYMGFTSLTRVVNTHCPVSVLHIGTQR